MPLSDAGVGQDRPTSLSEDVPAASAPEVVPAASAPEVVASPMPTTLEGVPRAAGSTSSAQPSIKSGTSIRQRRTLFQMAGLVDAQPQQVKQLGWNGLPEVSLINAKWADPAMRAAEPALLAQAIADARHVDSYAGGIDPITVNPSDYLFRSVDGIGGKILAVAGLDDRALSVALDVGKVLLPQMRTYAAALKDGVQDEAELKDALKLALVSVISLLDAYPLLHLQREATTSFDIAAQLRLDRKMILKPDFAIGIKVEGLDLDLDPTMPAIYWLTNMLSRLSLGPSGYSERPAFPVAILEVKKTDGSWSYAEQQVLSLVLPALRIRLSNKQALRDAFASAAATTPPATSPARQGVRQVEIVGTGSTPVVTRAQRPSPEDVDRLLGSDTHDILYSLIARGPEWEIAANAPVQDGPAAPLANVPLRSHKVTRGAECYSAVIDLVGIVLSGLRHRAGLTAVFNIVARHPDIQSALQQPGEDDTSENHTSGAPTQDGESGPPSVRSGGTGSRSQGRKRKHPSQPRPTQPQEPSQSAPQRHDGPSQQRQAAVSAVQTGLVWPTAKCEFPDVLDPPARIERWITSSCSVQDPNVASPKRDRADEVTA